jgi:transcription elongation factor Elf1
MRRRTMTRTSFQYMKNAYSCEKCGKITVTIDRDHGTSPFLTQCPNCKQSLMKSEFYRVPQHVVPTHEWYKPTAVELEIVCMGKEPEHKNGIREHVRRGGLLLREIEYGKTAREQEASEDPKNYT